MWGGIIGQLFVHFCVRRFAPSVVCSVSPVPAYFPLMDTSLQHKKKKVQPCLMQMWKK